MNVHKNDELQFYTN